MDKNTVVILAAGKGTRMKSELPKVLNKVNGKSLISTILEESKDLGDQLVVVGFAKGEVLKEIPLEVKTVEQAEQLGTGDALKCALTKINTDIIDSIILLPGDAPFIKKDFLHNFLNEHNENKTKVSIATIKVPNFEGDCKKFYDFGRVLRDENYFVKEIVELKDATEAQKKCTELNTSFYVFDAKWLSDTISKIENQNASHEYYLTDIVAIARNDNLQVHACILPDYRYGLGVNTNDQLNEANSISAEIGD